MTKRIGRTLCALAALSLSAVGCEMFDSCKDGVCASKPLSGNASYQSPQNVPIPTPPAEGQPGY